MAAQVHARCTGCQPADRSSCLQSMPLMRLHSLLFTCTITGFESSAVDGEGLGIDTFRPAKNAIKLSNKMFLPEEALERLKEQHARMKHGCACVVCCTLTYMLMISAYPGEHPHCPIWPSQLDPVEM
eukprot:scaffold229879_cov17-Tisochrysis_lutea.AAC.1